MFVKEFIAERKRCYYKKHGKLIRAFYWEIKRRYYLKKFYKEQKKYL